MGKQRDRNVTIVRRCFGDSTTWLNWTLEQIRNGKVKLNETTEITIDSDILPGSKVAIFPEAQPAILLCDIEKPQGRRYRVVLLANNRIRVYRYGLGRFIRIDEVATFGELSKYGI